MIPRPSLLALSRCILVAHLDLDHLDPGLHSSAACGPRRQVFRISTIDNHLNYLSVTLQNVSDALTHSRAVYAAQDKYARFAGLADY